MPCCSLESRFTGVDWMVLSKVDLQANVLYRIAGDHSVGHAFGATGARLTTTGTNRLHKEDGQLCLLAACADGGQAYAGILERAP